MRILNVLICLSLSAASAAFPPGRFNPYEEVLEPPHKAWSLSDDEHQTVTVEDDGKLLALGPRQEDGEEQDLNEDLEDLAVARKTAARKSESAEAEFAATVIEELLKQNGTNPRRAASYVETEQVVAPQAGKDAKQVLIRRNSPLSSDETYSRRASSPGASETQAGRSSRHSLPRRSRQVRVASPLALIADASSDHPAGFTLEASSDLPGNYTVHSSSSASTSSTSTTASISSTTWTFPGGEDEANPEMTAGDQAILRSRAARTSTANANASSGSSSSTGWMIGFIIVSILAVAFAGLSLWLYLKGRQPAQDMLPLTSSQPAHDEPLAPEQPQDAAASPKALVSTAAASTMAAHKLKGSSKFAPAPPATEKPTPDTAAQAQPASQKAAGEAGKDDTASPVVPAPPEARAGEAGKDDTASPVALVPPEASAAAANEPKASSNTEAAAPATEKPTSATGNDDQADDDDGGSSEGSMQGKNARDVDF